MSTECVYLCCTTAVGCARRLNSDMVRAIDLAPGGYGSEYGRGLGGLVTVRHRARRVQMRSTATRPPTSSTRLQCSKPQSTVPRASPLLAAGATWIGTSSYSRPKTSVTSSRFPPITMPSSSSSTTSAATNRSSSLGLISNDKLVRTVTNPDPAQVKTEETLAAFGRVMVRYRKQFDDGSSVTITPSVGRDHQ